MSEEEIIEENIRRYIKEHSTTIKAYTQEYVDKLQSQLQQKENIIKEVRGILKEGLEQFDTRRREEIYAEQYFENALEILDKVD